MTARGRGKEIQLQVEIDTQEDWEEQISKEGLLIVDVYQDWCGPCKPMLPIFKRIKNETGDDLLKFAIAKADSVEALERYRGKCEPSFLFYAGGVLVEVIHGADPPLIGKAILTQLAAEHNVIESSATRVEVVDKKFPIVKKQILTKETSFDSYGEEIQSDQEELSTDEEEEEKKRIFLEKEIGVIILTNAIYDEKRVIDIIDKLKMANLDILSETEIEVPREDVLLFFSFVNSEDYSLPVEDLIEILSDQKCYMILVSRGTLGKNVVFDLNEMLGKESIDMEGEENLKGLRMTVGDSSVPLYGIMNFKVIEDNNRAIRIFLPSFPKMKVSVTNLRPIQPPSTVGYIRAPLWNEDSYTVLNAIQEKGFKVLAKVEVDFSAEEVNTKYKNLQNEPYFEDLVRAMTSGPIGVLLLSNNSQTVVSDWLSALGPFVPSLEDEAHYLRKRFKHDQYEINMLDGSQSISSSQKEKDKYFKKRQAIVIVKPKFFSYKDHILFSLKDEGFIISGKKMKVITEEELKKMYKSYEHLSLINQFITDYGNGPSCLGIVSAVNPLQLLHSKLGYKTILDSLPSEDQDQKLNDTVMLAKAMSMTVEKEDDHFSDILPDDIPSYYPDQFDNLPSIFGIKALTNSLYIPHTEEINEELMDLFFGSIDYEPDGFRKKAKKEHEIKVCDSRPITLSTKEKVYSDVKEMEPPERKESEKMVIQEEDEAEKQRLLHEKMMTLKKEKEKDQAKIIQETKLIDSGEKEEWETHISFPKSTQQKSPVCCPQNVEVKTPPKI